MKSTVMIASCLCLAVSGPAEAHDPVGDRYDYVLDYPLLRPFIGPAPTFAGPFGYGGVPGGYYSQPVVGGYEPGGLVKANALIDEYMAERRTQREIALLRRSNEELRGRVGELERELARRGGSRRKRSR